MCLNKKEYKNIKSVIFIIINLKCIIFIFFLFKKSKQDDGRLILIYDSSSMKF